MPQKSNTDVGVEGPSLRLYQRHLKLSIRSGTPHVTKQHPVGKKRVLAEMLVRVTCCSTSSAGRDVGRVLQVSC